MKLRISLDRGGKIYLQKTKTWRKESAKADRLVIDIGPAALFFCGLFVLCLWVCERKWKGESKRGVEGVGEEEERRE